MDVLDRADLPFPHSLPEFQRLFPDDAACAAYLEKARWGDGFAWATLHLTYHARSPKFGSGGILSWPAHGPLSSIRPAFPQ